MHIHKELGFYERVMDKKLHKTGQKRRFSFIEM